MATLAYPAQLQNAQTGNADSTNTVQRFQETYRQMILRVVSTIGATPTVTLTIKGSVDGTTFFNVPYCVLTTQADYTAAAITITTAVTTYYMLMPGQPWIYLKVNMAANTNVTLTTDLL